MHYKRLELLKHNLVASFIHYKWNLFGRYIYYPNIIIYILLMLMLTAYMYLRFDCEQLYSMTFDWSGTSHSCSLILISPSISVQLSSLSSPYIPLLYIIITIDIPSPSPAYFLTYPHPLLSLTSQTPRHLHLLSVTASQTVFLKMTLFGFSTTAASLTTMSPANVT